MARIDELIEKAEDGTITQADVDRVGLLMDLDQAAHLAAVARETIEHERAADKQLEQLIADTIGANRTPGSA